MLVFHDEQELSIVHLAISSEGDNWSLLRGLIDKKTVQAAHFI
jgi:hypothetical protein